MPVLRSPKLRLIALTFLTVVALTLVTGRATASASAVPAGAYFVSGSGSDSNSGSVSAPWRTLGHAFEVVRAGDTVVVDSGSYGAQGAVTWLRESGTGSAPITVMGYPGRPRPTILGQFRVTGSYVRVEGLGFNGATGTISDGSTSGHVGEDVKVWIYGCHDVSLSDSEVSGSQWHAGVYLWNVSNARITANYVHDNGAFSDSTQSNLDHGIYWASGSGGLIADNVIAHNLAWGVQLSPSVSGVLVDQNTFTGNEKGGLIVSEAAADNTIANNIFADNHEGVRAWGLTGTGNTAQTNLFWNNPNGNHWHASGMTFSGDILADPLFVSATDYHLQPNSPAIDAADPTYSQPTDIDGTPRPQGAKPDLGAYEWHS